MSPTSKVPTVTISAEPRPDERARSPILVGLAVAVSLVVGILIGLSWPSSIGNDEWHTGTGAVGTDQVSIDYDGWTYGVESSVAWIDAQGTWHDGGWPTCLRQQGSRTVRFQARSVTVDDTTWRPIVAIDCR